MAISITITVSDGNEYKEVLEKYMPALGDLPESSVTLLLEASKNETYRNNGWNGPNGCSILANIKEKPKYERSFFDDLERESMYRKEVEHAITHL